MDLQEELKALKERIAELEEQVEQEKEFPQYGDDYWFLLSGGTIYDNFYTNSYVDNRRLEIGNVFKTKEQAEFAVEKLKVEAELRKFSRPFENGGFNYYISGDLEEGRVDVMSRAYLPTQGAIYFESAEKAQQAIELVGEDRIKKYIFGVED